jgi:O-antigen/teichoic acid export membrane protein
VLIIFARPFILHWIGEDFANACAPLLRLVLSGFILGVPGFVSAEVLTGFGKIGKASAFSMACAAGNIILSIVFVKVFGLGLTGVALGSVSMLVLMNGVLNPWLACRVAGLPLMRMLLTSCPRAFLGALPLVAVALMLKRCWAPANLFQVFVQFGMCGIAYALCAWFISLSGNDRAQLRTAVVSAWQRLRGAGGGTPAL